MESDYKLLRITITGKDCCGEFDKDKQEGIVHILTGGNWKSLGVIDTFLENALDFSIFFGDEYPNVDEVGCTLRITYVSISTKILDPVMVLLDAVKQKEKKTNK